MQGHRKERRTESSEILVVKSRHATVKSSKWDNHRRFFLRDTIYRERGERNKKKNNEWYKKEKRNGDEKEIWRQPIRCEGWRIAGMERWTVIMRGRWLYNLRITGILHFVMMRVCGLWRRRESIWWSVRMRGWGYGSNQVVLMITNHFSS